MTTLIDIHLPHMGSVERAVITNWHKTAGDKVAADEPLLDVSTDKVDTEVPSPYEGTLVHILAQPDQEVPVGELIARLAPLEATDDEIAAVLGAQTPAPPAEQLAADARPSAPPAEVVVEAQAAPRTPAEPLCPAPAAPQDLSGLSLVLQDALRNVIAPIVEEGAALPTSPLVRRLAKESGIDLAVVRGTGRGGRVTRADVQAHLDGVSTDRASSAGSAAPASAAVAVPSQKAAGLTPDAGGRRPDGYDDIPCEEVLLSPVRRATAAHMVASVSTAPQLTAQADVDFTWLTAARAHVNAERARRGKGKLSYLPFIARAVVAAVGEHPDINATFTDTHLLRWQTVNLGVAVDTEYGLYVPVVRDAQRLSLEGLAEAIDDVALRARERRLTAADFQGGTITISNSGSVGGVVSTPILTRPQVASLGVPAVVRQPVAATAENGEEYVAIRPIARLGLTFDHRAMDGSGALRALMAVQRNLQDWQAEAYR